MANKHNDLISEIVNRLAESGYCFSGGDEVLDELLQKAIRSDDVRVSQFAVRLGMYVGEAALGSMCSGVDLSETPLEITPELLLSFQQPTNDSFTELLEQFGTTESEMTLMFREGYRLRAEAREKAKRNSCEVDYPRRDSPPQRTKD